MNEPEFLVLLRKEIENYMAASHGRLPSMLMITRGHWDRVKGDLDEWFKQYQPMRILDDGPHRRSMIRDDGGAPDNLRFMGVYIVVLEDKGWALL